MTVILTCLVSFFFDAVLIQFMRNRIYLLVCLFCFSCGQKEGTNDQSSEINQDTAVEMDTVVIHPTSVSEIKEAYAVIFSKLESGLLDSISLKYDCYGERSGTITYFTDGGKLSMVKHDYNEYDHYSAVDQYFVSDSTVFFVHQTNVSWSFVSVNAAGEGVTQDNFTEKRMYVVDKNPILCLEKKYTIRSDRPDTINRDHIPNDEVECQSVEPVLRDFDRLVAFKNSPDQDCLEK